MRFSLITILQIAILFSAQSQDLYERGVTTLPINAYASIAQRIGISDITIEYHAPSSRNRKVIFGGLMLYDNVLRAGANENTTISLSSRAERKSMDSNFFEKPHFLGVFFLYSGNK